MLYLIGKPSIHPFWFYSGKLAGLITWLVLFLALLGIDVVAISSPGNQQFFAWALLVAGLILTATALFDLGGATRMGLPEEDTELKTRGLYRYSRNPVYVGIHLLTLSSVVYTMNLWILLTGAYSIFIHHYIILGEERFLEKRFGAEYAVYKQRVRRYL